MCKIKHKETLKKINKRINNQASYVIQTDVTEQKFLNLKINWKKVYTVNQFKFI